MSDIKAIGATPNDISSASPEDKKDAIVSDQKTADNASDMDVGKVLNADGADEILDEDG